MEWHGRLRERTHCPDFGSYVDANLHNIAPHSYYNVPQYPSSSLPRDYNGSNPNIEDYGHYDCNRGNSYSASSYVHGPVAPFQATTMPISAATRVHINPNYRPRAPFGLTKDTCSNRPVSVHINPHWKPRAESIDGKSSSLHTEHCNNQTSGKKTIFVNPKVLAQMNFKHPGQLKEKGPVKDPHFVCTIPEIEHLNVSSVPTTTPNSLVKNMNIEDVKCQTNDEHVLLASASEPSFVILTSRKLIRKPIATSHEKLLNSSQANIPILTNETVGSTVEESSKRSAASGAPTQKISRQVSSKYKLVRNSPSIQNATEIVAAVLTPPSRKSRRKSNSRILSKSLYKFIRKPVVSDSLPGSSIVKASRKSGNVLLYPGQSTPRENSNVSGKGSITSSARKNVRTQFRLVKFDPSQKGQTTLPERGSGKAMQSRYKIVRQGFTEFKSSVQMNNTSVCGFPLYSSLVRNKFKSLVGNKPYNGRKVSRFRIKTPGLMKISNSHQCPKPTKLDYRKSGLYKNIIWQKDNVLPSSQSNIEHHVLASIAASFKRKGNAATVKISNRSLVNIGGVLYRSSRTSLTRTHPGKAKERIVHIRGKRFVMDGQGKTLRPAININNGVNVGVKTGKIHSLARVDIGGVTFTRRSDNTLVRTNTHYARNLLSIAKTRSIALLTDKLRKNNQPCLIYHRFGKCHAHVEGKCWRVHDPKNIAICQKFLQGCCETEKCLLSHNVGPEKMPTCRYFLEGCCVRDNCPYLHVKLSARADICRQFLHGYCAAGDMGSTFSDFSSQCKKRHVHLCPDFDKDRKCKKGKFCPYPHPYKSSVKVQSMGKTASATCIVKKSHKVAAEKMPSLSSGEVEKRKRYYDKNSEKQSEQPNDCKQLDSEDSSLDLSKENINDEESDVLQKRPKIGILPAYIPL